MYKGSRFKLNSIHIHSRSACAVGASGCAINSRYAVFALLGVPPDVLSNASSLRVKVKVDLFMNMYQRHVFLIVIIVF